MSDHAERRQAGQYGEVCEYTETDRGETIDRFGCVGNSIKVYMGQYVDLLCPSVDSIDIVSIATSLAKTCRYGGHCPGYYSVAEHSVACASIACDDGQSSEVQAALLMHDAAEAYVGDMKKPLKVILGDSYKVLEQRFEVIIGERVGIDFEKHHDVIRHYDRKALAMEKLKFWPEDKVQWFGVDVVNVPSRGYIDCLEWRSAYRLFMSWFETSVDGGVIRG